MRRPPSAGPKRGWRGLLFGGVLSVLLIAGIAWSVPLREVWEVLRRIDPLVGVGAMVFAGLNLWLRGGRWSLLLAPQRRVSSTAAAEVAVLGIAFNAVAPGRLGEFLRIGLAARRFRVGVAFTTATLVTERLLDGLTLLLILGTAIAVLPSFEQVGTTEVLGFEVSAAALQGILRGLTVACLLLAGTLLILSLPSTQRKIDGLLSRFRRANEPRWLLAVGRGVQGFGEGAIALRTPATLVKLGAHSVLIWSMLVLCNWTVSFAVEGLSLSFLQAAVVTAISIAAASLPAAPGGWGVFEAGALLALVGTGVEAAPAVSVAYVFAAHLCQYLPSVVSGLVITVRRSLSMRAVLKAQELGKELPGSHDGEPLA